MKIKDLIGYLHNLDGDLEMCTCDLNGDVQCIEGFLDKERTAYLVKEPKPWQGGEDYYEYWTLKPEKKEILNQKQVLIIW